MLLVNGTRIQQFFPLLRQQDGSKITLSFLNSLNKFCSVFANFYSQRHT